jgi:hypothetical protein
VWLVCTAALTLWFARAATIDLSNFRPVSNDEGELIEVSYTLANQGVFGSPMYAGFFGADSHHLWTLPVQHAVDAVTFKVFGSGVAQARWVSVVAALVTLWCVGWLGLRWYGLTAAVLSEVLVTMWRSNLTQGVTGLPLLDVARVARYDVLAVAFGWLALLALARQSGRSHALAAGASASLAALSQFFGAAALPVVLLAGRNRTWLALGAVVVGLPWLLYAAAYRQDLAGQFSVYGARGQFLNPSFYVENLLAEPSRYLGVLDQPSTWLLLGLVPALVWLVWRCTQPARRGDRLLLLSLLCAFVLLSLLDATKTPLYAIVLFPGICLLLAASWSALLDRLRLLWLLASMVILAPVLSDGLQAYRLDRAQSAQVSAYLQVGQQIDTALAQEGVVLGPERWWWAEHQRPYISLRSLWFQWTSRNGSTSFNDLVAAWQPRSLIVNNNVRDDIRAFPSELQTQFWTFVDQCSRMVKDIDDPTYLDIRIYEVTGCYAGPR